jgi:hypothetical protein
MGFMCTDVETQTPCSTECANRAMDSQTSWATYIDREGEEKRVELDDIIPR